MSISPQAPTVNDVGYLLPVPLVIMPMSVSGMMVCRRGPVPGESRGEETGAMNEQYFLSGRVDLAPDEQHLDARLQLTLRGAPEIRQLDFLLHEDLQVRALEGDAVQEWSYIDLPPGAFAPEGRGVRVSLSEPQGVGRDTLIEVAYSGCIGTVTDFEINRITGEWVELGLYSPWFPVVWQDSDRLALTYCIDVSVPGHYQVVGAHAVDMDGERYRLSSSAAVQDVVLLAAPRFHTVTGEGEGLGVTVSVTEEGGREAAAALVDTGMWILSHYRELLSDDTARKVVMVVAPRSVGGGYVRDSFIVLSDDALGDLEDDGIRSFKWLAHEFAHLWWYRASAETWEDWLNESFAEYFAVQAVSAWHSPDAAEAIMQDKRKRARDLPPIRGIARGSGEAHAVLYHKGCVLLDRLADRIGRDRFTELARALIAENVASTRRFLQQLERVADRDAARDFGCMLTE